MGIAYNTSIVRDGLVLHLDAANRKSYPGTGTVWYDLSGNGSNGSMVNGVSITNNILSMDGVDDVVQITSWPRTSTTGYYTVEMLAKWRSDTSDMFMGFTTYDIYNREGHLGFNTGTADIYGVTSTRVTELGLVGYWKHYIFVFSTQVQNNEIWVNGTKETLGQALGATNLTSTRSFSSQVNIGTWPNGNQYVPYLDVSTFKIYNKKLSSTEIHQNFNAMRGRYGI